MDSDIIARMRAEEADLVRKLAAVRDFLSVYGGAPKVPSGDQPTRKPASREPVGIDGFGEYGRKIVAHSMQCLLLSPHPVRTRDVVQFLEALNIQISGENKINAVGALLARSRDIVSHGKRGWTVADSDTAREIVGKYTHKENEAPSEQSPEPQKPAGWGAPPPPPAPSHSNPWPSA